MSVVEWQVESQAGRPEKIKQSLAILYAATNGEEWHKYKWDLTNPDYCDYCTSNNTTT